MKQNMLRFWIVQVMTVLTFILFVSLGTWQLGRGNIKSEIESVSTQVSSYQQVALPLGDIETWRYKSIMLTGVYDSSKQFLLDNQVRDRIAGYNVITPLYVKEQQTWVLVDRGWIPQGVSREELPDIEFEMDQLASISGNVYVPYDDTYSLGGIADGEDQHWPRRIQFVDYAMLSDRLGVHLEPFTLRLSASESNGYRRDWLRTNLTAQKHYGYAFQWYAMALAVIALWWIYSIKPLLRKS